MPALWESNRDAHLAARDKQLQWGRELLKEQDELLKGVDFAQVLSAGATELSERLYVTPNWTAKSVLLVYISRALHAHEKSNFLTEVMFHDAWARATQLDDDFAESKEKRGPLHGCPISIKDHLDIKGIDTTIGFTYLHGIPAGESSRRQDLRTTSRSATDAAPFDCDFLEDDSSLVKSLIEAGGNPFVKTNIPQTMLSFECANPLFGVTTNPYDPARTPGGSSGGESAILASDASALGIGSDIGGSLRIPAHYAGCYGLKPTMGRTPTQGIHGANPSFEAIAASCGPMGRSVADLEIGMRCLVEHSAKYARAEGMVPLPWRNVEMPKKLKFGYYRYDGVVRTSPACARALQMSVDALRKKGHEVIEIRAIDVIRAVELFLALTSAGNYETLLGSLRGDPTEGFMWLFDVPLRFPRWFRNLAADSIERFTGDKVFPRVLRALGRRSVTETQAWAHERQGYAFAVRQQLFETLGLDALLSAPQATPALKCETSWDISTVAAATLLWNVVDSTAGVLPVTFVDAEKDALTPEFYELLRKEPGSQTIEGKLYGPKDARYNAKEMAGLPVGVQIIAAKFEEEKVIKMMGVIDEALGSRGFGPGEFYKREQKSG
ncbi:BQ2448_443 [Microbotryum intermedium]|uniref:amidase n=1 Tax=Microbotryum intermedium TaxID=269621 RepID=A0A238F2G3_9BASI|nr:BQ2448_443 [Microbotryum intermedium]